jgi:murein DD-endopeptidase MepM/ murein hydrolase activator NlpD
MIKGSLSRQDRGGITLTTLLLIVGGVVALAFLGLTWQRWERQAPSVSFDRDFKALGRSAPLAVTAADAANSLKRVTIRLRQDSREIVLVDDDFAEGRELSKTYDVGRLLAGSSEFREGPASLVVNATDSAFGNFLRGNRSEVSKEFTYDTTPPRLEVLSGQHYINQGGSEGVVYRVSEDADTSGVRVGPHFFPGFPASSSDAGLRFALFAFSYDLPADTIAQVEARDSAGNESVAGFWHRVFPKSFRNRDITIDDAFLRKVLPEILSNTPSVRDQGDLVKTFVEVNSKLRRQNHDAIARLSEMSPGQFLWKGGFLQLSNSQVESYFADRRTYIYQGNAVDKQDHVGFDLSVVEHYPIEAANDGKVLLAEYFGIYGNTVLLDHGAGLISLYGHMSSFDVKAGDTVKKKQILGRSGATGLAGGDHLHFGLFLHGVPVNPTEWWDEKWIRDHILSRLPGAAD